MRLNRVSVVCALVGLAGCREGGTVPARGGGRPAPLVKVARAEARDLPITLRAPVDLRPLAQADVGSKGLGYLDAVLVDRGDRVRRGQLLALVRPSDLPDQLAAARGMLAQAQAAATLARTNYERAKALAPSAVVSQQELQQAQAQLSTSEASESGARAQIAALGVRLGETRIESPLTGVVSARRVDPGALVGPSTGAILTVVRMDVLRVFVVVTERALKGVAVGKDAHIELDAFPDRKFSGKVVRIAPSFDPTTRSLEAEVQLANESGELRPGMYGRATIVLEVHPQATLVPLAAVQTVNEQHFVYVHREGVVKRRQVETGFEDEIAVEVVHGLAAGEEVVVAGIDLLVDGAKVRGVKESGQKEKRAAADREMVTSPPATGGR
jgi:RND family efflux transporter MFP subunit